MLKFRLVFSSLLFTVLIEQFSFFESPIGDRSIGRLRGLSKIILNLDVSESIGSSAYIKSSFTGVRCVRRLEHITKQMFSIPADWADMLVRPDHFLQACKHFNKVWEPVGKETLFLPLRSIPKYIKECFKWHISKLLKEVKHINIKIMKRIRT